MPFPRSPAPSAEPSRAPSMAEDAAWLVGALPRYDDRNPSLSITEPRRPRVVTLFRWVSSVGRDLNPEGSRPLVEGLPIVVPAAACSVVGAIQPDKLRQIWPKSHDCLLARPIYVWPRLAPLA